ncbi:MAG TPA: hypothetical protein VMU34_02735, partial [Mycobacterium sp.]|nr:hypothetical protein [Mycobacterium sp.]
CDPPVWVVACVPPPALAWVVRLVSMAPIVLGGRAPARAILLLMDESMFDRVAGPDGWDDPDDDGDDSDDSNGDNGDGGDGDGGD